MMPNREIDIYCDESYPDLLSSTKSTNRYIVIGGIWLPTCRRNVFKQELHNLRNHYLVGGEFKWTKATPSRENFYLDLVTWFFNKSKDVRFRCIVVDSTIIDLNTYHRNDCELGFYKFYYQLLHKWILADYSYSIFCDYKTNRNTARWRDLSNCLAHSNVLAEIHRMQSVRSSESVMLQLVDVIVGIVAAKYNRRAIQGTKRHLLEHTEQFLHHPIHQTNRAEEKFNVFQIQLGNKW